MIRIWTIQWGGECVFRRWGCVQSPGRRRVSESWFSRAQGPAKLCAEALQGHHVDQPLILPVRFKEAAAAPVWLCGRRELGSGLHCTWVQILPLPSMSDLWPAT